MGTVAERARWKRRRGCVSALGALTALSSPAGAVVSRDPDQCSAWAALPETKPFLEEVPSEGYVFLPFELMLGTNAIDRTEAVALTVEVHDADGISWPGYMSYAGYSVYGYDGTPLLWTSSRPFTPGGRYQLLVNVQNPKDCPVSGDPIDPTYDFVVSERTLTERLNAADLAATPKLEWTRSEFSPQCCIARATEHCADPEHCVACTKSSVWAYAVLERTSSPSSAYLSYNAVVRGPDDAVVATYPFGAADAEVRMPVPLCLSEYCAQVITTSQLTAETVVGEPTCVAGAEPQIDPPPDGAELVMSDPCADGSGPSSFGVSAPPDCKWYPEVRWFENGVDGLVALGVPQDEAEAEARLWGTGATDGTGAASTATGGTGGTVRSTSTDRSGCAVTAPHARSRDGSIIGLLSGLLVVRRRARRR